MKYTIIKSTSIEELEKSVNDYLSKGWKLQGGVCTVLNKEINYYEYYYQAMFF